MDNARKIMSRKKYEEKQNQLHELENIKMPQISKEIDAARRQGDLSENADYQAAMEDQAKTKAQIDKLKAELDSHVPSDAMEVFVIKNLARDTEETYYVVGEADINPSENYISENSPIGKVLMNNRENLNTPITVGVRKAYQIEILSYNKEED